MTDLLQLPVTTLQGADTTFGELAAGRVALVVNVASKCGLTPQYSKLEALQSELEPRGFTVLGFPCNQFGAQEPGTAEEIESFCSATYGVTFPMTAKVEVNGEGKDAVYDEPHRGPGRRWRRRRHPVELREVPRGGRRPGARTLPSDH